MVLEGEPRLGYPPIRAHMFEPSETLTMSSRVDYSRFQSIQHNIPVWFLGEVDEEDYKNVVLPSIDDIWRRGGKSESRRTKHSHRDSGRRDDKDRKHKSSRRK